MYRRLHVGAHVCVRDSRFLYSKIPAQPIQRLASATIVTASRFDSEQEAEFSPAASKSSFLVLTASGQARADERAACNDRSATHQQAANDQDPPIVQQRG